MNTKTYAVKLIGKTPLIMHRDNIAWGERVKAWSKDPAHKSDSTAGDDRTPAWTWLGYLYHDDHELAIDSDNLMSMLRDGGKKCPAPKGKGSMKVQTQSGIICGELTWKLDVGGKSVAYEPLLALAEEEDFGKHLAQVEQLGFKLFIKRARIGQQKHVRVRPFFKDWTACGTLIVTDKQIDLAMLTMILSYGGVYAGLCDWRPGSRQSPGAFGKFIAEVKEV